MREVILRAPGACRLAELDLALAESECIRARSCEELEADGVCTRAANDPTIDNDTGRPATRRLCP